MYQESTTLLSSEIVHGCRRGLSYSRLGEEFCPLFRWTGQLRHNMWQYMLRCPTLVRKTSRLHISGTVCCVYNFILNFESLLLPSFSPEFTILNFKFFTIWEYRHTNIADCCMEFLRIFLKHVSCIFLLLKF